MGIRSCPCAPRPRSLPQPCRPGPLRARRSDQAVRRRRARAHGEGGAPRCSTRAHRLRLRVLRAPPAPARPSLAGQALSVPAARTRRCAAVQGVRTTGGAPWCSTRAHRLSCLEHRSIRPRAHLRGVRTSVAGLPLLGTLFRRYTPINYPRWAYDGSLWPCPTRHNPSAPLAAGHKPVVFSIGPRWRTGAARVPTSCGSVYPESPCSCGSG